MYPTLEKLRLQHTSVKVINLKMRIPEFGEAERAELDSIKQPTNTSARPPDKTAASW